jgi:hypothetical protein
MTMVMPIASGSTSRDMAANSGEMKNIMPSTPMMVSTAVMSWVRLCCSEFAMLSMSLVTRLRMSPRAWPSKYDSGSRAIFSSTLLRILYTVRWDTPAMR